MTTLLSQAEARRRHRVQQEYSRRGGSLQAAIPAPEAADWLTRQTLCDLQSALHTADPSQALGRRHLLRFLTEEYLHHQTRALQEVAVAQQQAAVIQAPMLDEPVPLWQVSARLARDRRRLSRGLLEDATTMVIGGLNQSYRELWSQLYTLAQELGYTNMIALWEELSGVRLDDVIKPLEAILGATEDTYREVMEWYLKRAFGIGLEGARRHDILALFRQDETEVWFPAPELISTMQRWLTDWGWSLEEHTNLHLEQHSTMGGGACCAPFDIPQDIRLALAPTAGLNGFAQALGETGKALLLASLPADAPMELRCFPEASLLEAQAEVLAGLVRDRHWVTIYRHVQQPGEALHLAQVERLFIVRRYIGKCLYERALYEDASLDGKDEAYVDVLRSACGFSYPGAYFLHDVEPGFGTFWRLRGWTLSAHLRRRLQQQYAEEWFREPEALEALREVWYQSPAHTLEAMIEQVGGSSLDVAPLVADLLSAL